jgi:hypothetical protein
VASRPKSTTDILDWEALEQAPNVRGAYSFLSVPAQVVSIRRGEEPQASPLEQPISSTVDGTSTVDRLRTVTVRRRRRVYECKLVQDGHSQGETILYEALWSLGPEKSRRAER